MKDLRNKAQEVIEQVNRYVLGKKPEVREVMIAILAGGHVLLEDMPGVGKTTMAVAFSKSMGLECRRVQFTPDVMPSDLTGFSIYQREKGEFVYQKGSLFCNLLLADELNRASPKTQSALLEAMEETTVSVEGITRALPSPFFVIATQNPYGGAGTNYLPEAQVDRFMVSMSLGYPDFESELLMAKSIEQRQSISNLGPAADETLLMEMQRDVGRVFVSEAIYRYLLELVTKTRDHPYLERGASPRATIALVKTAKADAWLKGRDFVIPADVTEQYRYVIGHRIALNTAARMERKGRDEIGEEILKSVEKPPMGK